MKKSSMTAHFHSGVIKYLFFPQMMCLPSYTNRSDVENVAFQDGKDTNHERNAVLTPLIPNHALAPQMTYYNITPCMLFVRYK